MSPRKAKARDPMGVGQCSVCDEIKTCIAVTPRIRYCRECIRHTLGWTQMNEALRASVISRFNAYEATDHAQALTEMGAQLTPEQKRALAIGESKRRLMDAQREEMQDG